jgi:hypothetical protein
MILIRMEQSSREARAHFYCNIYSWASNTYIKGKFLCCLLFFIKPRTLWSPEK